VSLKKGELQMKPSKVDEAERAALAAIAQTQAEIGADEMQSDPSAPPRLVMLARRVRDSVDGSRVTAIRRITNTRYLPAFRPPDAWEDKGQVTYAAWSTRRVLGELLPTDPRPITETRVMWAFIVHGNPIEVEGWLRDEEGYRDAFVVGPNCCLVMEAEREG
jgi:hypothetical protein